MGTHHRRPSHDQKAETFSTTLRPSERGDGLEMKSIIDHANVGKPKKPPGIQGSASFRWTGTSVCQRMAHPCSTARGAPGLGALLGLTFWVSSSGCSPVAFII